MISQNWDVAQVWSEILCETKSYFGLLRLAYLYDTLDNRLAFTFNEQKLKSFDYDKGVKILSIKIYFRFHLIQSSSSMRN